MVYCDVHLISLVQAMWNFLSIRPDFLGAFIFFLYDDNRVGRLKPHQIQELIETIHSGKYENNPQIKKLVTKLVGKKDSPPLTIEAFTDWARTNPALIQPFISIQHKLRSEVVGTRFWEEMTEKRQMTVEFGHPRYCVNLYKRILSQENGRPHDDDAKDSGLTSVTTASMQTVASSRKIIAKSKSQVMPDNTPPLNDTFSQLEAHTSHSGYGDTSNQPLSYDYTPSDNVADNIKESGQGYENAYGEQQEWYGDERDGYYYDYHSEQWVPYPSPDAPPVLVQRTVSAVPTTEVATNTTVPERAGKGTLLPPLQKKPAPAGEKSVGVKKKKKKAKKST